MSVPTLKERTAQGWTRIKASLPKLETSPELLHTQLRNEVSRLEQAGAPVPCRTGDPDRWTSDVSEVRRAASGECWGCPLTLLCASYAKAASERWGVWGGIDRETVPRPRRKRGRPRRS